MRPLEIKTVRSWSLSLRRQTLNAKRETKKSETWVAGADGCRAGWIVILRHTATGAFRQRSVSDAEALASLAEAPAVVAIDMPIGLPEVIERGGRACDRQARQLLGRPRASSVFSPPARAALACTEYDAAQAANRAHSEGGIGLSKMAFNLFSKMRAVDATMTPARQKRLREVHPELSFYAMNGGAAVAQSKHGAEGRAIRTRLLKNNGFEKVEAALHKRPRGVAPDDLLDASAACWTAARIRAGRARRLPDDPPADARGLRMEIWF